MSIIRLKRRTRKKLLLKGILFTAIPLLVCIFLLVGALEGEIIRNKKFLDDKNQSVTAYMLQTDVAAGQTVSSGALYEVRIYGTNGYAAETDRDKLTGKKYKTGFKSGTILLPELLYEEQEYNVDVRKEMFDFIQCNQVIEPGSYIDVRIEFPNGENYIVAAHKKVLKIHKEKETEEPFGLEMNVTEEEILRFASAYIDSLKYENTKVYAVLYMDEFQPAASVTYPVNQAVFQMMDWNPNLVNRFKTEDEQRRRIVLESNLDNERKMKL